MFLFERDAIDAFVLGARTILILEKRVHKLRYSDGGNLSTAHSQPGDPLK